MNDKKAHEQLKKINAQRNAIGIGGFKDSRRAKVQRHETFNEIMNETNKAVDEQKMKEIEND